MSTPREIGRNVQVEETDDEIIITIKKNFNGGPSGSGKTIIVATTSGNKQVTQSGIVLGLNAYKYPER